MSRKSLLLDAGLAALVTALTLAILHERGLGTPDAQTRPMDALSVLLALVTGLPVAVRRLAPLTVFLATAVAGVTLSALHYAWEIPIGPLAAVYTLGAAYGGDHRRPRRWGGILASASLVPATALATERNGYHVTQYLPELSIWVLAIAGVWIAGDRTRLRQERISQLEAQADRIEREAERERRLAVAEERTRIARELHDSAGHAINVILVQAGAARLLHERDPERSRAAIGTIEEVARSTIGEIDRLVRVLREDAESPPADPAALEDLVERHRANGLHVAAEISGARKALPASVTWAAYRILQEALTNAARHGGGTADVTVDFDPDVVRISVANPTGHPQAVARNGHGIIGMRERAGLLGGSLETALEQGTFRLHARLPYQGATT